MGLDTVELVMEIETKFDIRVDDTIWAKTETVENLSRRERALKDFTVKNEKMLENAAKSIKTKLNGE